MGAVQRQEEAPVYQGEQGKRLWRMQPSCVGARTGVQAVPPMPRPWRKLLLAGALPERGAWGKGSFLLIPTFQYHLAFLITCMNMYEFFFFFEGGYILSPHPPLKIES